MPIRNRDDAVEVENRVGRIFAASPSERAGEIRALFVEALDFGPAAGHVGLDLAPSNVVLPAYAERVAELGGVHVLYVALDTTETDRVRKAEAAAAAKLIEDRLGDDLLLVFTNTSASQLHLIQSSFEGARPTLRRMIVERDLPRRTAVQQVSHIYWNYQDSGSIRSALDKAFDVEAVTRAFFKEYKDIFDLAIDRVEGFGSEADELERKKLFVQTLFNRLMFIYFLSRKGWLAFHDDNDYLNALWKDYQAADSDDKNFHVDRLSLLFFAGLNNPQSRDLSRNNPVLYAKIGAPPFLNGGLFEKTGLDKRTGVVVPDGVIEPILSDLFDRFNFTVMESTPFDIEVAVDPEMLGKVFEELVTGRHDSGSYYTPRPVVSFMCREALKGCLEGCDTGLAPEEIARFVDERDTSGVGLAYAPKVAEALENVTVVDPACGSGAYLLGMMQELVDLRQALFNVGVDARSLYELKLHIIQRNLYGVDIDEFAINIAMLRMWLSLVIEYEGDTPEPLPNLDFKVVEGDSLLGPDPGQLNQSRYQIELSDLPRLKARYMPATADKDELRREIAAAEERLRNDLGVAAVPDGVVDWRIEFAEVFANGGFDVVIANPPYVRQEKIKPASYKSDLLKAFSSGVVSRSDLYCYFYVRALQLLTDGGVHVFVCSNSWLDVGYGAKLQEHLLDNSHVLAIYESAIERQFSTAQINTVVSMIQKTTAGNADESRFVQLRERFEAAIAPGGERREIVKSRSNLLAAGKSGSRFVGDKWGGKYLRAPDIYHHVLDKCAEQLVRLGDIATVRRGITTGANEFFFLNRDDIDKWSIEDRFLRPVLTSPQESRSILVDSATLRHRLFMCHEDRDELAGTGALAYIEWGETQGYHQRRSVASRRNWYDIGRRKTTQLAMNYLIDTTARTYFVSDGLLFGDNFQTISIDEGTLQLCVPVNSTLSQLFFNILGRANFGGGLIKIQTFEMENMPTVSPSLLPSVKPEVFAASNWDVLKPSPARRQIDNAVFDALRLTTGEREAVYEGVSELVTNRKRRARSV